MEVFKQYISGLTLVMISPVVFMRNIYTVSRGFISNGDKSWAFCEVDFFFRAWYEKLANDFRKFGRFGYAWDDGLGLPLGPRFYNNFVTYWLYGKLGAVRFTVMGWLLMATTLFFLIANGISSDGRFWIASIGVFWVLSSPSLSSIYVQFGKPETFWWWMSTLGMFFGLRNGLHVASVIWSAVALVNVPVAVLSGLVFGVPLIIHSMLVASTPFGLLWLIPGLFKIVIRVVQSLRSGFFGMITDEQAGLRKRKLFFHGDELSYLSLSIFLIVFVSKEHSTVFIYPIVCFALVFQILFFLNRRLIYINDDQSYALLYFGGTTAFGSAIGDPVLLLIPLIATLRFIGGIPENSFARRRFWPVSSVSSRSVHGLFKKLVRLWYFPFVCFLPRPSIAKSKLIDALDALTPWSRIAIESYGKMRESGFARRLQTAIQEPLMQKRIGVVNDIYAGMTTEYRDNLLWKEFFEDLKDPAGALSILESYWVRYVLAFTPQFQSALESLGFQVVASIDLQEDSLSRRVFRLEERVAHPHVTILRAPYSVPQIKPQKRNKRITGIEISNISDKIYKIPYIFFRGLRCYLGDDLCGTAKTRVGRFIRLSTHSSGFVSDSHIRLRYSSLSFVENLREWNYIFSKK